MTDRARPVSPIRRESIAHPATGQPIIVGFSVPSEGNIYAIEVVYQGRTVRYTYPHDGEDLPHPADALEWLAARLDIDLTSHARFIEYSQDEDTSLIVYRAMRNLEQRAKRAFGADYADFIGTDWTTERHVSPYLVVWEKTAPAPLSEAEASRVGGRLRVIY